MWHESRWGGLVNKAPKGIAESLSMGSSQCCPHFLLKDEASVVLSLLPQMPLNQHFSNEKLRTRRVSWLVGGNARIRMQVLQLLNYHSSISLVNHIKCQMVATQACYPMCPCSLLGVPTNLADCYQQSSSWHNLGCLFRHLPFVSFWDLATTLPASGRVVPSILCLGYVHFMPRQSSQQTCTSP